jgi:hypothetical protein
MRLKPLLSINFGKLEQIVQNPGNTLPLTCPACPGMPWGWPWMTQMTQIGRKQLAIHGAPGQVSQKTAAIQSNKLPKPYRKSRLRSRFTTLSLP